MRPLRSAFTLFELILAIALSVALLALIGTAINLYLLRVDVSRTRIEEAQLARSVLAMIAEDLRATSVYKPQDTSGIASLVAASAKFDPDSIDAPNTGSGGGGGGTGGGGGGSSSGGGGNSGSGGAGGAGTSGTAGSLGGTSLTGGSSSAGGGSENDLTLPLGVNGTVEELYVDVEHVPRLEELFRTNTGYTNAKPMPTPVNAPFASPTRPSNVRTVRYFIRQGRQIPPGSPAATSLASEQLQMETGGLVRQEIARPMRLWAEQSGDQTALDSGQALVAPEVTHIEFRYFDGTQVVDYWDMKEKGMLPPAIEVTIWILASGEEETAVLPNDLTSILARSHEYHQIVYLPTSALSASGAMSAASGSTSSTSSSSSSSSSMDSSSTSGLGSSFDQ